MAGSALAALDAHAEDEQRVQLAVRGAKDWLPLGQAKQLGLDQPQTAGFGGEISPLVRGDNTPFRRLTKLYELPDGHAAPFRRMIANPEVVKRLTWMLGPDFHESVPPEASLWQPGSAGISLHGSAGPGGYLVKADGALVCEQVNVAWQLREVAEADGGFMAIAGSHRAAFPVPLPASTSMEMECVEHVAMGAGDVLFFLGGACAHAAAAWRGQEARRNVIHKYSPSHKALPRGHFLVPTFVPKL
jgi:hypothetical protein